MPHNTFDEGRKARFLEALEAGKTIKQAAAIARVSERTVYNHQSNDPDFAEEIEQARARESAEIYDAVKEWATEGVDEVLHYQGKISLDDEGHPVTVKKRSQRLMERLAEARLPEFKRGPAVQVDANVQIIMPDIAPEIPTPTAQTLGAPQGEIEHNPPQDPHTN